MSDLDVRPELRVCGGRAQVTAEPVRELLTGRAVPLGESTVVRRLLPTLGRRMVGAWCFVDHYGPDDIADRPGMRVPPHPHIGLQTVSWLLDGQVHHTDSLGSDQMLAPGQLGLMTAGRAIAHAEQSPTPHPPALHGAQLWVALPEAARHTDPAWEFHPQLPVAEEPGLRARVIMGQFAGVRSPGRTHTPLVGVDLAVDTGADLRLPLEPDFEYAALSVLGEVDVDGVALAPGSLLYLGCGRRDVPVRAATTGRLLLLGGEPFAEQIVMWWNFVARTGEEIATARNQWISGNVFGTVHDYPGDPLPAPPLPPTPLLPRGRQR